MPLATQVAGILLAGAIVVALARQAGLGGRGPVAAVAVVPVVVAAVGGVPGLRNAWKGLLDERRAARGLTPEKAAVHGGAVLGVDVRFLDWVDRRLRPGDTFFFVTGKTPVAEAARQWGTFQLAPHLAVAQPEKADWVVVYGGWRGGGYPRHLFGRPRMYARGYFIVARRHAR